jgi:damage-control phosphatase, subfamily III
MDLDPPVPKCMTSDSKSFAYPSVRERWPAIITSAIDDLHRTIAALPSNTPPEHIAHGKAITSALAALKYELQHNRVLTPLPDESGASAVDLPVYNDELADRIKRSPNNELRWHDVEWLFSECYMYRRMNSLFATSSAEWASYDVFRRQKTQTFKSSRPAVLELAARYREIVLRIRESSTNAPAEAGSSNAASDSAAIKQAERVLFEEMAEICLWGNATDLSLLTTLSYEDIQKLQGSSAKKSREEKVLVNQLGEAFETLWTAKEQGKAPRRVDFVLDNAGFELYVDLVLAGYLIETSLATEVVMHPKSIPWFVSDVVPRDLEELLEVLRDPRAFYETKTGADDNGIVPLSADEERDLKFLFEHWASLHSEGQLILRPNRFWTHPGSFWRLPSVAPELLEDMKEAELTVFKGDLNYRKLIGDVSSAPPFPSFIPSRMRSQDFFLTSGYHKIGTLGPNHAVHRGAGAAGRTVWAAGAGAADVQRRCCRWAAAGERRRAARPAGRWRRLRKARVGVQWQVGGRAAVGWQGLMVTLVVIDGAGRCIGHRLPFA